MKITAWNIVAYDEDDKGYCMYDAHETQYSNLIEDIIYLKNLGR